MFKYHQTLESSYFENCSANCIFHNHQGFVVRSSDASVVVETVAMVAVLASQNGVLSTLLTLKILLHIPIASESQNTHTKQVIRTIKKKILNGNKTNSLKQTSIIIIGNILLIGGHYNFHSFFTLLI